MRTKRFFLTILQEFNINPELSSWGKLLLLQYSALGVPTAEIISRISAEEDEDARTRKRFRSRRSPAMRFPHGGSSEIGELPRREEEK
jgi:hypothetical protein